MAGGRDRPLADLRPSVRRFPKRSWERRMVLIHAIAESSVNPR